ncbi:Fe(3+)-hydroxamate ABC transporter permease FhuB [Rhizobium daejeonense]|uniref:Fe(3+)-hydroxamate ABC transporter permease FhuB n=1 Tax=Rhizobium daejeonense TaxID=240521 RepID=A0A6M1S9W3_9HYPH|nr:Fe(3+)-hydroxamate ABC transporter permease FhuB [Rhizobium daejeonense]NGO65940.1 Fe(3+)-hydroxamate ABC transporter permease FhuB [Rhizobium daejeonense]
MKFVAALRHPAVLLCLLGLLAAICSLRNILAVMPSDAGFGTLLFPDPANTAELLLHYAVLPRIVMALIAGGALGLSGALLQRILKNPLAEPATLGVSAGAYLMLAITGVFAPSILLVAQEWIAIAGAVLALVSVLGLSWNGGLAPETVTLSGLIVTLYCGTASAVLTLFNHDLLLGLFIWGAGYLDQQDWAGVLFLAPRLAFLAAAVALIARPLTILSLDERSARSLGLSTTTFRIVALALAAALTGLVTAWVGIISFIGLAAPAIAAGLGMRRIGGSALWSSLIGGLLLLLTDQIVLAFPVTYRLFPVGTMTALLAAPLLMVMILRLRPVPMSERSPQPSPRHVIRVPLLLAGLLIAVVPALWLAVAFGRGLDGWVLADGDTLAKLAAWRLPRALSAFAGGAMLALAGAILQRMTANPLASPEILGVSSGALVCIIAFILTVSTPTRWGQIGAGAAGALAMLIAMLILSNRPGYSGNRLLLLGISLSSISSFIVAVLMTSQDPRLGQLLSWLSGSTYAVTASDTAVSVAVTVLCCLIIPLIARWLALLSLGENAAASLGLPLIRSRSVLFSIAAVLTATATTLVGPFSFSGLMGPHLAGLIGFRRAASHLLASALIGGLVLLIADWAGRNLIFPYQIPAGLLATLIGGPFLLLLIGRKA